MSLTQLTFCPGGVLQVATGYLFLHTNICTFFKLNMFGVEITFVMLQWLHLIPDPQSRSHFCHFYNIITKCNNLCTMTPLFTYVDILVFAPQSVFRCSLVNTYFKPNTWWQPNWDLFCLPGCKSTQVTLPQYCILPAARAFSQQLQATVGPRSREPAPN